ncbi:allatostatin-A receptor-like [Mytilus californianus]|uniref:allatostatin-A receptor-like n=1 Tax=Mytilus californianus TaxID=6549 RepID=UPI00224659E5|nr:allatostatin-A receptor-like [Mytilus californianus]
MMRWICGDIGCKLSYYLVYLSVLISVYTLVIMSLDRYLAIVHPITSKIFQTSQNVNLLVFIACISKTSEFLAYVNRCINPILYTFISTKYRQSLRKLLCCKRLRQNNFNS